MADTHPTSPQPESPSLGRRLRAGSKDVWDKIQRSPSRGSEGGNARASIASALGNAGVVSGLVGSPLIDPKQRQEDVREGVKVFVQELERVVSQSRPGIKRTGTIEVELNDASGKNDVHPIVSVEDNPFVQNDAASDMSYDFVETIEVMCPDKVEYMRALLDTGMRMNAIHYDKVLRGSFNMMEYKGPPIKDADGPDVEPIGVVEIQFYFKTYRKAKSWNVEFVVLRDPPFDVALGSHFINLAGLLKRTEPALPMTFRELKPEERREQEAKTQELDKQNDAVKAEQKRKLEERRRIERERKDRDRDKDKDKKARR